jgi:hypothetical protein
MVRAAGQRIEHDREEWGRHTFVGTMLSITVQRQRL